MARLFVTTGNDQFTQALVTSLSECDVELVDEAGAATHVLLGARPGSGMAAAVADALAPLDAQIVYMANALEEQDGPAVEVVRQSGLPWTIVYPNAFMEYSFGPFAPQILMGVAFGMSGRSRVGFVALDDVARVVAHIVEGSGHEGQEYICTGPQALDMPGVVALLAEVVGRNLDYIDLPENELADLMMQHAGIDSREDLENMVLGHLRAWRDGHADVVTDTVAELTGQEPMSAREWFERNLSQFSGKPSLMQKAAHKMIKVRYGGRVLA
jgi:hypothetical protein